MLELRLLNRVPKQAASIAHVYARPLSVPENVSLADYSRERTENSLEYFGREGTLEYQNKTNGQLRRIYSDEVVLGNRSVLSGAANEGRSLFFRYPLGKWASILLVADSGSVSLTTTQTQITLGAYTYTYEGKTVREVVKEINDEAANGVAAYVLYPGRADFAIVSSVTVDTSGYTLKNETYRRVYSPEASTTDMDAARETVKRQIELLADGEKTNEVHWDLVLDGHETNGFRGWLYVDRKSVEGKTFQVRFPAITTAAVVESHRIEAVNPLPYLIEGFDYSLTKTDNYWEATSITDAKSAMAIGVFGASGSVTISTTQITISGTSVTYTGKSLRRVVAELNDTFTSYRFTLLADKGTLDAESLVAESLTIIPSGVAIRLKKEVYCLFGPDARIHPLLPYDEEAHRPWYPRVNNGRFSEVHYTDQLSGYDPVVGGPYNGKTPLRFNFAVPEYASQTWKKSLGQPWRAIVLETPIQVTERILRTRRFPLESQAAIALRRGDEDLSSKIQDVDLEQGFIFLTEVIQDLQDVTVDYVYEERSLVYDGIDLNTVNNPDIVGKFVGVYAIPEQVSYILSAQTRTVYHVVRDTAAAVKTAVSALNFANAVSARALLLGIYQVLPSLDRDEVAFEDAAPKGGGLEPGVKPIDEGQFVTEEGRWDGEPFEGDQALVLEVPDSLIPTSSSTTPFRVDPAKQTGFMTPDGLFDREEIERKAGRWTAPGTLTIVETS